MCKTWENKNTCTVFTFRHIQIFPLTYYTKKVYLLMSSRYWIDLKTSKSKCKKQSIIKIFKIIIAIETTSQLIYFMRQWQICFKNPVFKIPAHIITKEKYNVYIKIPGRQSLLGRYIQRTGHSLSRNSKLSRYIDVCFTYIY